MTDEPATKADIQVLRGEMVELRTELRGEMGELRTELRTELRGEMRGLRTEMAAMERRILLEIAQAVRTDDGLHKRPRRR